MVRRYRRGSVHSQSHCYSKFIFPKPHSGILQWLVSLSLPEGPQIDSMMAPGPEQVLRTV